jgi:hypothetical protein
LCTDTRLGREVILERFAAGYFAAAAGARHLAWLRAMARAGGPRLQRVLGIERGEDEGGCAVFEAVSGRAPSGKLAPAEVARLAAALAPLHAEGLAHGAIQSSVVLEEPGLTLLVAGRQPTDATPADDRAALAELG